MEKTEILSLLPAQLEAEFAAAGFPRFRARQVFRWLHVKRVFDFVKMTDLSKQFQSQLAERFYINMPNWF